MLEAATINKPTALPIATVISHELYGSIEKYAQESC